VGAKAFGKLGQLVGLKRSAGIGGGFVHLVEGESLIASGLNGKGAHGSVSPDSGVCASLMIRGSVPPLPRVARLHYVARD
jgi:hypothetical protein